MGKSKVKQVARLQSAATTGFVAAEKTIDPGLASLFATSSGPISVPERIVVASESHASLSKARGNQLWEHQLRTSSPDIEELSEISDDAAAEAENTPPRKRQKVKHADDLESSYLNRLAQEDAREERKRKSSEDTKTQIEANKEYDDTTSSEGESDEEMAGISDDESNMPQHESLTKSGVVTEADKSRRTVFLSNVSISAIRSKVSRKDLLGHLSNSISDLPAHNPPHKVDSFRFRSTAFVSGAGPKRAAFAKGELMDQTTQSTNAYVVYTTELAARQAASKLNGTIVLDRHLRADSLARPTPIEHRRCVFVGNLSFVDEEVQDARNGDDTQSRPKAKLPADAEEGLWRTFLKAGKIESVRVVRDKETRVGKGFAYVQFFNENAVEAALLMNDKKYPPMLPRKLRVMRAKNTKPKANAVNGFKAFPGATSRGRKFGNDGFAGRSPGGRSGVPGPRTKEGVVFEGHRASKSSRDQISVSKNRKRYTAKPKTRSSRRGAAYKAAGGTKRTH